MKRWFEKNKRCTWFDVKVNVVFEVSKNSRDPCVQAVFSRPNSIDLELPIFVCLSPKLIALETTLLST